jgi:hypothetical protein
VERFDLKFLKKTLIEIDPSLERCEEDESFKTALVLLAALSCGPNVGRLADITHAPREFVTTIRRRMIQVGLWTELDVCCDHWFASASVLRPAAFWSDVLIAQGLVTRKWFEEDCEYRYSCSPNKDDNPSVN